MKKSFLCLLCVLLPISLMGATIFSDNFDSCSGNCNSAAAGAYWDQWTSSGGSSATHDSVTHYSGEISSPGRGGSGMSYKIWRYGTDWGDSNEFTGGLVKYIGGTYNDIWIRYYIKIPTAMTLNGCDYVKLWMLNPLGGEAIYIDFANVERGTATLILDDYNDGSPGVTLLDATETLAIWDGDWHCLQYHFDNTSSPGTIQLYVDGTLKYNNASFAWGSTARWDFIQHFHIGNHADDGNYWQTSWQAMEIDDFILATTKAETDPDGTTAESPPSTPTIRNGGFRNGGIR